jgi:hypothetical protein
MTAGGQGVSTPKIAYTQDAPLFAAGRAACTAGMVNWHPLGAAAPGKGKERARGGGKGGGKPPKRPRKK